MDIDATNAFKELFEEIDKLLYQPFGAPPAVENAETENSDSIKSAFVLKDKDIDELIEYSKKFVEKTKHDIGISKSKQFQEHGVQCARSERKNNKKLNTPPKWISGGKDRESAGTNCATAIRIIKRVPKAQIKSPVSNKSPEKNLLNNQRPANGLRKVRNVGVNVNFISKSVAKHSNNTGQATVSAVSDRPPIIKKPPTPQSAGKIYRFYCSKLSPSQLWEQQHPELAYQSSERSIFPKRIKKSDLIMKQNEQSKIDQPQEFKVIHLTEGLVHCAIAKDKDVTKINEEPKVQDEEPTMAPKVTPAITKHVIPAINIKGDWKACLQVQETCRINIFNQKRSESAQIKPSNLMYVEVKHGGMNSATVSRSPVDENIEARPTDAGKTVSKTTSEVVIDQKCVEKSSNSPKTNRYLQPFINVCKARVPSYQQLFVDLSDSSSDGSRKGLILESDSSDSDSADNLQSIMNFKSTEKAYRKAEITEITDNASCKNELPIVSNGATPKASVQLQVPSPPCRLSSPPKTPAAKSPPADDASELCPDFSSSSKFLENLRIWNSAIQVQSENMKLGNQLTENLDTLKQNMEVIAGETQNIAQITRSCEHNLKQIEGLKERYARNLDGSTVGSFRQGNQFTMTTNHEITTTCSCFGCRPQQDTFDPEPNFDQKAFQRAVLAQNPRYSKTIQKICDDGRNRSFRKSLTPPRDVAEQAAQKFLESYSHSVSRISNRGGIPLDQSPLRSHSVGSVSSWNEPCRSEISSGTESDVSISSSWKVGDIPRHREEYSDSVSVGRDLVADTGVFSSTSISDDKSSDGFRRIRKSLSDEGEVLSQGEIR